MCKWTRRQNDLHMTTPSVLAGRGLELGSSGSSSHMPCPQDCKLPRSAACLCCLFSYIKGSIYNSIVRPVTRCHNKLNHVRPKWQRAVPASCMFFKIQCCIDTLVLLLATDLFRKIDQIHDQAWANVDSCSVLPCVQSPVSSGYRILLCPILI